MEGEYVATPGTGEWVFVAVDAPEQLNDYAVPVARLSQSPEAQILWLALMSEKPWFDPKKLVDFFTRLRKQINL